MAITRLGIRRYYDLFQKRIDPRGKTYYWLAGEVLEEVEEPTDHGLPTYIPTDVQAIRQNLITVTPLKYNLTHTGGLGTLTRWLNDTCANLSV